MQYLRKELCETQNIESRATKRFLKNNTLLEELTEDPFGGTGKPEALKYDLAGLWSRRINQEHRLVYEVVGSTIVVIFAAKGHYQ